MLKLSSSKPTWAQHIITNLYFNYWKVFFLYLQSLSANNVILRVFFYLCCSCVEVGCWSLTERIFEGSLDLNLFYTQTPVLILQTNKHVVLVLFKFAGNSLSLLGDGAHSSSETEIVQKLIPLKNKTEDPSVPRCRPMLNAQQWSAML